MKIIRLFFFRLIVVVSLGKVPTITSFVLRNGRGGIALSSLTDRFSRYYGTTFSITHLSSKQKQQEEEFDYRGRTNGVGNGNVNSYGYGNDGNYGYDEEEYRKYSTNSLRQAEGDPADTSTPTAKTTTTIATTPIVNQSPDRAISIVSELKANAALFAAFAFGSLNLPATLTVSESKVTSVTTSLSISRPLPDSDLVRTFVILDVSTLCLMISCVAASQLLIYRLTDGSYEDVDEYAQENIIDTGSRKTRNSRDSALGRLVTTYRDEFTVARLTFDLGLVTLLLAVGVRVLAIYDEDIVVPVAAVIGTTAVFLAVAYLTSYVEVFRTAENLSNRPLSSIKLPFLKKKTKDNNNNNNNNANKKNRIVPRIILPLSLVSVGLGLYLTLGGGSMGPSLSRLGPYDVTGGAIKLRVVTEKIDSEKGKLEPKGRRNQRKEQRDDVPKKARANVNNKARAKAASEKSEAASKAKVEADATKRKAQAEAKQKAEEEAAAAAAKAKLEAAVTTAT